MPDRYDTPVLGVAQGYPTTVTIGQLGYIYSIAEACARALDPNPDFTEDASQNFGARWLAAIKEDEEWAKTCLQSKNYLTKCASRSALRLAQQLRQLYTREPLLCDVQPPDSPPIEELTPSVQMGPERRALQTVLSRLLFRAVCQLQDRPKEIVVRRICHEESTEAIASRMNCTPNAICVALTAARKRLADLLIQAGCKESDVRDFLYEILRVD